MNNTHIREEAFIGEGTVYIKLKGRDDLGVFKLGNATEFATAFAVEVKERISRMRGSYGQVLNTVTIPKPGDLSVKIDTINKETLAMAMMGTLKKEQMTAETVSDEEITFKPGIWLKLPHRYIDGEVTVKDSAGTEQIEAEHIEVEARMGLIRISETGAAAKSITDGQTIKVSYKTATWDKWLVSAFKQTELKGELWLDGKNRVTGEDVMLHMPQFTLAVDGSFNFFTEDFNEIQFKGRAEIADGEDAAFYVELKEAS